MKMHKINIVLLILLHVVYSSCNSMAERKREYNDSIVITYYKGLDCTSHSISYDQISERAHSRNISDTLELSSSQFYTLKKGLICKKVLKKRDYNARIFIKWDTSAVCLDETAFAIDKDGYGIYIDPYIIHKIMTLSQYYNYFPKNSIMDLQTIRKYGIPADYHFIYEPNIKILETKKVLLVPDI